MLDAEKHILANVRGRTGASCHYLLCLGGLCSIPVKQWHCHVTRFE